MMGTNCSSPMGSTLSGSGTGLDKTVNAPPEHDTTPVTITNNNPSINMKLAKVLPNNNIKSDLNFISVKCDKEGIIYDKDDLPVLGKETKVEWDNQVPLMDPNVVAMLVEKMKMMKMMKKMGKMSRSSSRGMMPGSENGPMGNVTMMDGKMPPNGTTINGAPLESKMPPNAPTVNGTMSAKGEMPMSVAPNGMPPSNGAFPPNGMPPPNGAFPPKGMPPPNGAFPPKGMPPMKGMPPPNGSLPPSGKMSMFPKLMGSAENAVRVVRHMKMVFNSAEIQDLCDEKMDPAERNIMFKMMQCKLAMEFKVLSDIGMLHLVQLIATGKLPPLLQLIFICYQDEPEVMKELSFVGPVLANRPDLVVKQGDPTPPIVLRTCAEEAVSLTDLHINKEVPMVVFAASSS